MLTLRLVYEVRGVAKFLSHLDILKLFNRALRRAGLPVAYSEGFNPHARISFGPPRGVGQEGLREYCDLQLDLENNLQAKAAPGADPGELCRRLDLALPKGVRVLEGRFLAAEGKTPALMAEINLAVYEAAFSGLDSEQAAYIGRRLAEFAGADKAEVVRHHPKKGDKLIDLKAGVAKLELVGDTPHEQRLRLEIPFGAGGSVKPVEVMDWLLGARGDLAYQLARVGLYVAGPGGERRLP